MRCMPVYIIVLTWFLVAFDFDGFIELRKDIFLVSFVARFTPYRIESPLRRDFELTNIKLSV